MTARRIAVVGALADELRGIAARIDPPTLCSARSTVYLTGRLGDHDVVVLSTGIGAERAEARVRSLLETESVDAIVALGFAGGLRDVLLPGDVLVAREVVAAGGTIDAGTRPAMWPSDARLLEAAPREIDAPAVVRFGRLVTVDRILRSAGEKLRAGTEVDSDAADG